MASLKWATNCVINLNSYRYSTTYSQAALLYKYYTTLGNVTPNHHPDYQYSPQTLQTRGFSSTTATDSTCIQIDETKSLLRGFNGSEIILIGTAHVSKQSAEEVKATINQIKPDFVLIELCPARAQRLRQGTLHNNNHTFLQEALSAFLGGSGSSNAGRFGGGQFGQHLVQFGLSGVYKLLEQFGMEPGGEFKAAMEAAESQGARIILGDQPVDTTMKKLSNSINMQDIFKLLSAGGNLNSPQMTSSPLFQGGPFGLEEAIEAMKNRTTARQAADYIRSISPQLAMALIDERDMIMSEKLLKESGRGVAVVGLAHMDGMERIWKERQQKGLLTERK